MNCINWNNLAEALTHHTRRHGFTYRETPWLVAQETTRITFPEGTTKFATPVGDLVGSGEQSFLEIRETLAAGKYCTITPCFREEEIDDWHQHYFMKLELIQVGDVTREALREMIGAAKQVFESIAPGEEFEVVETGEGYDIEYRGIELGSYGIRVHDGFTWVYGTGLAEPRFSKALRTAGA